MLVSKDIFDKNDQIWLFGSRVYDSLKGGDIDLYIETHLTNSEEIFNKKMNFFSARDRALKKLFFIILIYKISN